MHCRRGQQLLDSRARKESRARQGPSPSILSLTGRGEKQKQSDGGLTMNEPLSILLPYQRRWLADQSQVKVSEKSRRIGITWTEAADRALGAATSGRAGIDGCTSVTTRTWRWNSSRLRRGGRALRPGSRAVEEIVLGDGRSDILAYRIRFASGHKIVALSSRPSNLRGKHGCAVIDEAAFHEDCRAAESGARVHHVGRVVRIISTHNGAIIHSTSWSATFARAGGPTRFIELLSTMRWRRGCTKRSATERKGVERERQREWRRSRRLLRR